MMEKIFLAIGALNVALAWCHDRPVLYFAAVVCLGVAYGIHDLRSRGEW